jgi:hypothetical protein
MKDVLESIWREVVMVYLMYYSDNCPEGLRKALKDPSQDARCHGQDSNRKPPEKKSRASKLNRSVPSVKTYKFLMKGIYETLLNIILIIC